MAKNGFELGTAWIQITPSLRGASRQIQAELSGVDTSKVGSKIGQELSSSIGQSLNLKTVGAKLKDIGSQIGQVGAKLTKSITAPAAAAATAVGGITAALGWKRLVGIDTAKSQLQALGHDAESVETIMTSALASVKGTAFGLGDAAQVAATAVAAGVKPGEELTKYLSSVGDAAAIAGIGMADMGQIFNQVQTGQVAYTDNLNMLADRGLPIYQWLAEEAGVAADEVKKMASDGKISSEMFFNAIRENIGGAAGVMGQTSFTGAAANVQAAIGRIGAAFLDAGGKGGGFFSQLKPLMADFTELLDSLGPKAEELGVKFGEAFAGAVEKIKQVIGWWQGLSPAMQGTITKLAGVAVAVGPVLLAVGKVTSVVGGAVTGIGKLTSVFGKASAAGKAAGGSLGMIGKVAKVALGPIGLIIGGLAALIAASPELRATLGQAFQQVAGVVGQVVAAIGPLVQALAAQLVPVFQVLVAALAPVVQILVQALVPVISAIVQLVAEVAAAILPAITAIIQAVLPALAAIVQAIMPLVHMIASMLIPIIQAVLPVVTSIFSGIVSFLVPIITTVVSVLAQVVSFVASSLGPIFSWLFNSIVKPIWDGIKAVISFAWNSIIKPIFESMKWVMQNVLGPAFNSLYENVVKPVWNGIKSAINAVGSWFENTLAPIFHGALDAIGKGFEGFKKTVENVWNAVKNAAMAPVRFVVYTVYRDGIKALFDEIAKGLGMDLRMPAPPKLEFASGGVLPGYTPGRDVHEFYSPTGGRLHLSGGEGIIRPDALRALGGKPWLDRVNRERGNATPFKMFSTGGVVGKTPSRSFFLGGIIDFVGDTIENVSKFVSDVASVVGEIVSDPVAAITKYIVEPIKEVVKSIGGGVFGEILAEAPFKVIDGIIETVKNFLFPPNQAATSNYSGGSVSYGGYTGGPTLARLIPVIKQYGLVVTDTWGSPEYNASLGRSPQSYHGDRANPAVDMAGSQSAMFAAADKIYAMGGWRQILWQTAGHYDHIHVANEGGVFGDLPVKKYDSGGWLQPGLTLAYNETGKPEPILTADQWEGMQKPGVTINQHNLMPVADPNVIGDRLAAAAARGLIGVGA